MRREILEQEVAEHSDAARHFSRAGSDDVHERRDAVVLRQDGYEPTSGHVLGDQERWNDSNSRTGTNGLPHEEDVVATDGAVRLEGRRA